MSSRPVPHTIKELDSLLLLSLERQAAERGGQATDPDWLAGRIAAGGRHLASAVKWRPEPERPGELACLVFIEMADGVDLLGSLDIPAQLFHSLPDSDRRSAAGPAARLSRRGWLPEAEWISRFGH
jgi:hypothetical protein